ncbi:AAA family ATPase [Synechococcus sp. Cruz-9H2]|uniref:AAA family ATPase n=1 Tax=unclassified Synechococcus TaxID=2626047 RepID=UPI0020CC888C|nr:MULTISPECIES: AAA family ATPase [unclassified Synechococcus]MCP9820193.1 AAA family ATPase [Synechococcus sp. Cruz-9H2]MCP9844567.1 AAA family ATPase [Synechococcus sp. Edmonson 11F2]MCP9856623.1 AAA family ATPase [Synechococcus sp. Cruz-9C9]MCP9863908.1 AAA family ATPase [Synechococcus sp. Cruz-7E5]MCP9871170.1 AAA family ATPase [Synechococcus sp. Cruz-7B9]
MKNTTNISAASSMEQSPEDKIQEVRIEAIRLIDSGVPVLDRVPLLREQAKKIGIQLSNPELGRYLKEACSQAAGTPELVTADDVLDLSQPEWICEHLLMAGCINLLFSLPKVGKTTLILALLGALHRGESTFLGLPLIGTCPPVLIIGTDQPERDWARILQGVGLVYLDEAGDARLCDPPIVGLAHSGCPWYLDEEGIQKIAQKAADNPGLLIIVDTLHACCRPLGINENTAELADPVIELMEAVGPYGATVVVIHHANKGRSADSASMGSRGNTALPAAASQIISLNRLQSRPASAEAGQIMLRTEGRAGAPLELLVARGPDGGWIHCGESAEASEAQLLVQAEQRLNRQQRDVLQVLRDRFEETQQMVSVAEILERSEISGQDPTRVIRRYLDTMSRCGLVILERVAIAKGQENRYRPVSPPGMPDTTDDPVTDLG